MSLEDEAALKFKKSNFESETSQIFSMKPNDAFESQEFMALNRKQPGEGFSPKTEEEVKRKREALLAELRKKKKATG